MWNNNNILTYGWTLLPNFRNLYYVWHSLALPNKMRCTVLPILILLTLMSLIVMAKRPQWLVKLLLESGLEADSDGAVGYLMKTN